MDGGPGDDGDWAGVISRWRIVTQRLFLVIYVEKILEHNVFCKYDPWCRARKIKLSCAQVPNAFKSERSLQCLSTSDTAEGPLWKPGESIQKEVTKSQWSARKGSGCKKESSTRGIALHLQAQFLHTTREKLCIKFWPCLSQTILPSNDDRKEADLRGGQRRDIEREEEMGRGCKLVLGGEGRVRECDKPKKKQM